jgi:hypothetical protein
VTDISVKSRIARAGARKPKEGQLSGKWAYSAGQHQSFMTDFAARREHSSGGDDVALGLFLDTCGVL